MAQAFVEEKNDLVCSCYNTAWTQARLRDGYGVTAPRLLRQRRRRRRRVD